MTEEKNNAPLTYASSGVDISAGESVVSRIKDMARATFTPETLSDIGSFGAMYAADFPSIASPALVSSADGVGTKLKVAFLTGKHDTVGEDLVNHCIDDILVQGARPLFFMDYFASGALEPDVAVSVMSGIARGCKNSGLAFIGGETAEMPDFYAAGEYDLAGFIVGVVDREKIIDGSEIREGDRLIGIASSGLHTNGYSLARKALFDIAGHGPDDYVESLGMTVGQALLKTHVCYLAPVTEALSALGAEGVTGMAHITGGGIAGNVERIIPGNLQAQIDRETWKTPELFNYIQRSGSIETEEMYKAFNMGVGYILAVRPERLAAALDIISRHHMSAYEIGSITRRERPDQSDTPAVIFTA